VLRLNVRHNLALPKGVLLRPKRQGLRQKLLNALPKRGLPRHGPMLPASSRHSVQRRRKPLLNGQQQTELLLSALRHNALPRRKPPLKKLLPLALLLEKQRLHARRRLIAWQH
jgi:hypothetical protein